MISTIQGAIYIYEYQITQKVVHQSMFLFMNITYSTPNQLKVIEAITISLHKPSLCSQREFGFTLDLFNDLHQ